MNYSVINVAFYATPIALHAIHQIEKNYYNYLKINK
jgi:hypothetical protein